MNNLNKVHFLILPVLFITIFLYCDTVSVNIMEARNFITAREMIQNSSWLLPTMNGELRIAKPPLPTWFTAVAMMASGRDDNMVANRIPAGLSALLLTLFTYLIVRKASGERGLATTAMLVLATSYLFLLSARKNEWDIFSITFMAGSIWALLGFFKNGSGKGVFLLLSSLLMACSFYSKGPVPFGVMLLPFLLSYGIIYGVKDYRENWKGLVLAFALCAVVSAVWPLYVYFNTPRAAAAVVSTETGAWFRAHTKHVWYYLLHLQEIAGIWVFFLIYGLVSSFREKTWRPSERLFVYWFILTLVFITAFPEKKLRYLLPAVVPGAVVASVAIRHLSDTRGRAWRIVYGAFCIVTGLIFIACAGALVYLSNGKWSALLGAPPLAIIGFMLLYSYAVKRTANAHFIAMAGICIAIVFLPPFVSDKLGPDEARPFLHLRQDPALKGRELYSLGGIPYEVIWASGRVIRPLDEKQIDGLKDKGSKYALMTTKGLDSTAFRVHLRESIPLGTKTYYLYLSH